VRGNTTGRLCIADAEYCIGRGVAAIRGKSGTYGNDFLEFVLLHQQSRILDLATGGGSTFPNINKPQLQELAVPLPPLPEQRAIAQVLRTVQRAKAATEKVLAATKQLKQSLLRHLFTYGPIPFDQADQVELKETAIGPMPEHWEVVPLNSVSRLASGGTPSKQRLDFWRGLIPWVSPKDMKSPRLWDAEDHISEQGLEDGSRLVPAGSLFIVVRGMILAKEVPLALAMTSMAFNQDMKAILPNDRVLSSDYLLYALIRHRDVLLPEIGTSAHGTRRIGTSAIENLLKLPLPTDQAGILARLADERLVVSKPGGRWDITALGAILFAKTLPPFARLGRKALRVIKYRGTGRTETEREWHDAPAQKGYATAFEAAVAFINSQLPQNELIGQAFRTEVRIYPEKAIRELVANALIHQDFAVTGAGPMVEIFTDRMEITNPGEPLVEPLRFIDSPPRSRNEGLAAMMRRMSVCEERGSGIDKVIEAVELFQLPAPDFTVPPGFTKATLFAPQKLTDMDSNARIRACYQHACLCLVLPFWA
jgi:restriction endonuclease S subunit